VTKPGETTLVFVGGMSDIDEVYAVLEQTSRGREPLEVVVCHSAVGLDDQLKVGERRTWCPKCRDAQAWWIVQAFQISKDRGKLVIATNMAESSVTLPDVKTVIDFGICKRMGYDQREHRTVLKQCWISKASAKQRAGRTG
jgi:HrpA-like RNA helicase